MTKKIIITIDQETAFDLSRFLRDHYPADPLEYLRHEIDEALMEVDYPLYDNPRKDEPHHGSLAGAQCWYCKNRRHA